MKLFKQVYVCTDDNQIAKYAKKFKVNIIKRPKWWVILVFLPTINLLMIPVIWIEFIKRFKHDTRKDILLMLCSLG